MFFEAQTNGLQYINGLGNPLSHGQFKTSAEVQTEYLTWGSIYVFSQTSICLDFDINNREKFKMGSAPFEFVGISY